MNKNSVKNKKGIIALLGEWTSPLPDENRNELRTWQERIINSFLLIGMSLGVIVMIQSAILSIRAGLLFLAIINIATYIWVWVLFFRRSFSYYFRVVNAIAVSYGLGLVLLVVTGPFGAGPTWLFFFPVVTGLLLEFRWAIASLGINLLTIVGFGWLTIIGFYNWPFKMVHPMDTWGVICLNFMLLSTVATVSIVMVVRGLQASLSDKDVLLSSLQDRNQELQKSNHHLISETNAKKEAQGHLQKSEKALKESEIRFRELVNLLPLAYILIDSQLFLQFINRKAVESFGFKENNLGSQFSSHSLNMLIPRDRPYALENIHRALRGDDIGWISYTALTDNGKEFPVEMYVTAVLKEQDIVGVQGIIIDVTDKQEKEKLRSEKNIVEKSNKAISEWVNFIAHEIRNPISGTYSFSKLGVKKLDPQRVQNAFSEFGQMLDLISSIDGETLADIHTEIDHLEKTTLTETGKLTQYFEQIMTSSQRLNHLLSELLDLSKLESGHMSFSMKEVNMSMIIKEAFLELEATLAQKQLQLVIQNTDINTKVECDSFRIGQLLRNLLSNAIKFTPNGKTITISLEECQIKSGRRNSDYRKPALKVTVTDEGIGIPKDQISIVFNKFKQSRKTRKGEGTGLGLPICKEIATAHGGNVWVESIEHLGTQFHFSIPYKVERSTPGISKQDPAYA